MAMSIFGIVLDSSVLKLTLNKIFVVFLLVLCDLSAFSQLNADVNKAYRLDSLLSVSPEKLIGNLNPDTTAGLPIGLSKEKLGVRYIIAIDSAYFLPTGAYFSAYMALKLPGAKQKLLLQQRI